MRSGGGYSILVGYQFILGIASMQRISSDHVGGDIFGNLDLSCRLRGLYVGHHLLAVALWDALVAMWALYSSRSTWFLGSTLAAASGFSLLQRRGDKAYVG